MARKPWCRVLYWFATLLETERINRELDELRELDRAKMKAATFHDPERVWRAHDDAVARLQRPLNEPMDRAAMIAEARALMARVAGRPLIPEPVS